MRRRRSWFPTRSGRRRWLTVAAVVPFPVCLAALVDIANGHDHRGAVVLVWAVAGLIVCLWLGLRRGS